MVRNLIKFFCKGLFDGSHRTNDLVETNSIETNSLLYSMHTGISACMRDVVKFIKETDGVVSDDDYANISRIEELEIIGKGLAGELFWLVRLRNTLIACRVSLSEDKAMKCTEKVIKILKELEQVIDLHNERVCKELN